MGKSMMFRLIVLASSIFFYFATEVFTAEKSPEKISTFNKSEAETPSTVDIPVYTISEVILGAEGKVPDFSWVDENGVTLKFSEVSKNKVVFLNFWATWCGPCRREVPDICELKKEFPEKDVVIIGVALDKDDANGKAIDKVKKFIKDRNVNYTIILGDLDLIDAFGSDKIQSIPTTFIIDKQGNIPENAIIGARSKDQFGSAIKEKMN